MFKKVPQLFWVLAFCLVLTLITTPFLNSPVGHKKLISSSVVQKIKPIKSVLAVQTSSPSASLTASTSAQVTAQNWGRSVSVPILIYHYIGLNPNPADTMRDNLSVHPDVFDDQMSVLASNGYHPISLDSLYAGLKGTVTLPSKPIVLTFDDGYIDFYINAFPVLRKYGFQAVSFIPPALMDQGYYLHWNQIKEMDASGLISFQAHSINHVNLVSIPQNEVLHQLLTSKKMLEEQLGKPVNFMAYPYGVSDAYTWSQAKEAGYLGALGTWYGTTESEGTIYDMPRVKVAGTWTKDLFSQRFP